MRFLPPPVGGVVQHPSSSCLTACDTSPPPFKQKNPPCVLCVYHVYLFFPFSLVFFSSLSLSLYVYTLSSTLYRQMRTRETKKDYSLPNWGGKKENKFCVQSYIKAKSKNVVLHKFQAYIDARIESRARTDFHHHFLFLFFSDGGHWIPRELFCFIHPPPKKKTTLNAPSIFFVLFFLLFAFVLCWLPLGFLPEFLYGCIDIYTRQATQGVRFWI